MDAQQQIFSLMAAAEEQQKAVKAAIDGLAEERAAVARERAAMGQVLVAVNNAAQGVRKAAEEAVATSVAKSLSDASRAAAEALSEASKPVIDRLSGVVKAASNAEGKLKGAVAAFGWKWAVVAGGCAAGAIAALLLTAWISVWWQRHQVINLREQKTALQTEVAELQANVSALETKGGRITLSTCPGTDAPRLCIPISRNQGKGQEKFVGSFLSTKTGAQFVIPQGY